jgi:uncharacterized protein YdeI (YjbR/CyaY-like superfamily)
LNVPEVFGTKGRVKVKCTINGFEFRTSIAPMGGCYLIGLNKEVRDGAKVKAGDIVDVIIEKDDEPRIVVIPNDMLKVLGKNKITDKFKELSYTHQKEYVRWVEEAKKAETREKRIKETIKKLREK